jgi:hypothetical protein
MIVAARDRGFRSRVGQRKSPTDFHVGYAASRIRSKDVLDIALGRPNWLSVAEGVEPDGYMWSCCPIGAGTIARALERILNLFFPLDAAQCVASQSIAAKKSARCCSRYRHRSHPCGEHQHFTNAKEQRIRHFCSQA